MTRVLPLPAPARMSTGPSVVSTAARCCGLSLSRKDKCGTGSEFTAWILQGIDDSRIHTPRGLCLHPGSHKLAQSSTDAKSVGAAGEIPGVDFFCVQYLRAPKSQVFEFFHKIIRPKK